MMTAKITKTTRLGTVVANTIFCCVVKELNHSKTTFFLFFSSKPTPESNTISSMSSLNVGISGKSLNSLSSSMKIAGSGVVVGDVVVVVVVVVVDGTVETGNEACDIDKFFKIVKMSSSWEE